MIEQASFKGRESYLEWRCHWRKQYNGSAKTIRHYKNELKAHDKSVPELNHIRALLKREQMQARFLMIARAAVRATDIARWAAIKNAVYAENRVKRRKDLGLPEFSGRSVLPDGSTR